MNDRGFPFDSGWDDGVYGTGSTQPPKSHRALLALLLVIIIFLGGIATALSILNIRLFHELHQREDALTVAYAVQSQTEAEAETDPHLGRDLSQRKDHRGFAADPRWGLAGGGNEPPRDL